MAEGRMEVLIAEDDPVSRRLLEVFLAKWDYATIVVSDGEEAWDELQKEDSPRLAILDWMMPGMSGLQVCRELRSRSGWEYVYVILVTSKTEKRDLIEGLEGGADDYLIKPFDQFELKARLRAGARIVDLQQKLLSAQTALREQATHDALTGVLNRAAVLADLGREIARSQRDHGSLCLAIADVDHFKSINDKYGHLIGDVVLREVIQRLRASIRPYDSIGRYGGEEFLIVAPNCQSASALSLAERLRASVAGQPCPTEAGPVPVTLSMGVAISRGYDSSDALIRAADEALYRAKYNGRNRVELASGEAVGTGASAPAGR